MPSSRLPAFIEQFRIVNLDNNQPKKLLRCLSEFSDPRAKRCIRHLLSHILVISIYAVIGVAKTPVEISAWAQDVAPQQLTGYAI